MSNDLKESLMLIGKGSATEYECLKNISTEDFLVKYKVFIDEFEAKQK